MNESWGKELNVCGSIKKFIFDGDVEQGKKIYKVTFAMAWPSVLEAFLLQLTAFLDTIMVSSLGISAVAAIGLTAQPKFIGLCIFVSMSIAVSSLVARRRGEQDRESANKILRMSLLVGMILIVVITVVFVFGAGWIMSMCGAQDDTHQMATDYLRIIMGGIGFTAINMIINAAQRGAGKTRIAMATNITSNVINVIFNYLLIGGNLGFPALGAQGAAIATVIGSVVACTMSIISICHPTEFMYIRAVKGWISSKKDRTSGIDICGSAFVEQVFLRIGFLLFVITVANLGTTQFGAHQVGMNFMGLSFAFADGLAVASVALVGRSLGEKRTDLAKKYATACLKLGIVCAIIVSCVFLFFGRNLYSIFSDVKEVLDLGEMIMRILCVVIYAQILQVTIIGCLRGSGDTKYTAFISLISVTIIRPIASWVLCYPLGLGLFGIWMGLCADQTIRLVMSFMRFKKGDWLKIKI